MVTAPVFSTSVEKNEPDLYSILYPVMAEPPSLAGAVQKRLTCVGDTATAASPVGVPGTVAIADAGAIALKNNTDVIRSNDMIAVLPRYGLLSEISNTETAHEGVFRGCG